MRRRKAQQDKALDATTARNESGTAKGIAMSASVWTAGSDLSAAADAALKHAARFWFVVAVLGQWMFVSYVADLLWRRGVAGDLRPGTKSCPMGTFPATPWATSPSPRICCWRSSSSSADRFSSFRRYDSHAPAFHRWNGRIYIPAVFLTSIAGLYMVWGRGTVGDVVQHLGDQPRCDPDHDLRGPGLALRAGSRHTDTSPLGPSPVHGGERRLVLPGRTDAVDLPQSRARRFRSEDVHRARSSVSGLSPITCCRWPFSSSICGRKTAPARRPIRDGGGSRGGDRRDGRRDLRRHDGHVAAPSVNDTECRRGDASPAFSHKLRAMKDTDLAIAQRRPRRSRRARTALQPASLDRPREAAASPARGAASAARRPRERERRRHAAAVGGVAGHDDERLRLHGRQEADHALPPGLHAARTRAARTWSSSAERTRRSARTTSCRSSGASSSATSPSG